MEAWMVCDKILDLGTTMDRVFVPQQDDGSSDRLHQVHEKSNDFLSGDRFAMGLKMQGEFTCLGRHGEAADQIQALVVVQAGILGWGFAAQRPGPFERRDLRKTRFVE